MQGEYVIMIPIVKYNDALLVTRPVKTRFAKIRNVKTESSTLSATKFPTKNIVSYTVGMCSKTLSPTATIPWWLFPYKQHVFDATTPVLYWIM